MTSGLHVSDDELEAGLPEIRRAPAAEGTVELIVRRPAEGEREVLDEGMLDLEMGLVGDRWLASARSRDEPVNTGTQLTLMNARDGRHLRLRGMNCRVVEPGVVRTGDAIRKL